MRYITEAELREQFSSGLPACYELPSGCMLTPSARQYLMDLKLYQQGTGRQGPQAAPGSSKPEHMTHLNSRELVSKAHPAIALRGKLDTLEAEILILDDALSAVDGRTEHQILHNLRQWGEGRTVIISAHRLSALTEASEILVMQHGHISQRGRHEALAAQPGWYRDMYRYQQLEAALDDVPQEDKEVAGA